MKEYLAAAVITLHSGVVRLTKEQYSARMYALEKLGGDRYQINGAVQFKVGEAFGYEGDLPKTIGAEQVITDDFVPVVPAAKPKAAVKVEEVEDDDDDLGDLILPQG